MRLGSYKDLRREIYKSTPANPLEWDESFLESVDLKLFAFESFDFETTGLLKFGILGFWDSLWVGSCF